MKQYKYFLQEKDMPTSWYNIVSDMKNPPPPYLHPATLNPMTPDDLMPVFPSACVAQEASREQFIEIPDKLAIRIVNNPVIFLERKAVYPCKVTRVEFECLNRLD